MEAKTSHIIRTAYMPLGKSSVNVEYELVDGQAQVLNAFINGIWTDPEDFLAESVFDDWQAELTRNAREDAARLSEDGAAFLKRIGSGQLAYLLTQDQQAAVEETMEFAREVRA